MMNYHDSIDALVRHLTESRQTILNRWREAAENDPRLSTASQISFQDFLDGMPLWLDRLNDDLRKAVHVEHPLSPNEELAVAESREHGADRWEQGCSIPELTREWGHLQRIVSQEIDAFRQQTEGVDADFIYLVQQTVTQSVMEGVNQSVTSYFEMEKFEAARRLASLQSVLYEFASIQSQRADALREVTHDLRGGLQLMQSAAQMFAGNQEVAGVVERGVTSMGVLLEQLTDLARLEAGVEEVKLAQFDVGALLRELCVAVKSEAQDKSLYVETSGPDSMLVLGDAEKIRRIAQNLLLNALNYTQHGGVSLEWSKDRTGQWKLVIADTGPGGDSRIPTPGEGIGLSIVRRLTSLLDAQFHSMSQSTGTTFTLIFPATYKEN